ncbi:MAG: OmpW family protein [Steroidobacterales bacterium]
MINPTVRTLPAALLTILAMSIGASSALAADTVDSNQLRLGLYAVFYHSSADDLQGPYVPPGVNLKADDVNTLYIGYIRRLSPHFEAELAIGLPPVTKTEGKGLATVGSVPYAGQVISTARWFAPTLLFNYKFFDENAAIRPYIGVGVNYTTFYDRNSTAAGNAASGGPTKLSLTSSVGPSATFGVSYKFAPHWGSYVSYSFTKVDSDLTADTAGIIRTTHIKFAPQALVVSIGYSF